MKFLLKGLIFLVLIICVLLGAIAYLFMRPSPVGKRPEEMIKLATPQPNKTDTTESILIEPPPAFKSEPEYVAPTGTTVEGIGVIDNGFAFVGAEDLEFVTGYTVVFSNSVQVAGFNVELQRPDLLLDLLITAIKASGIEDQEELAGLDNIGDSSVGVTLVTNWKNTPLRVDGVIFRRNDIGAVAAVVYVEGKHPSVAVGDVAREIDDRLTFDK